MLSMLFPCFSHAFHAFIFVNSYAFHGFPWFYILCFPCFPWFSMVLYSMLSMLSWGILLKFSCSMLAWKAWKFSHENHGILLLLHAPCFSRESMEFFPCFSHGFSMVYLCFQYKGMKYFLEF